MMRRKSERNKGKSPETKVEKPKRGRPSRRRKKSSSSSPERVSVSEDVPDTQEVLVCTPEKLPPVIVPTTGTVPSDDEDTEQVWHVKASESSGDTGEIQKLKICLSRPSSTPERPDRSPRGRKKLNRTSQLEFSSESSEEKRKTRHRSRKGSTRETSNAEENISSDNAEKDIQISNEIVVTVQSEKMEIENEQGDPPLLEKDIVVSNNVAVSTTQSEVEMVQVDSSPKESNSADNTDEKLCTTSKLVDSQPTDDVKSEDKGSSQENDKCIQEKTEPKVNAEKSADDIPHEKMDIEEPSNDETVPKTLDENAINTPPLSEDKLNNTLPEVKGAIIISTSDEGSKEETKDSSNNVTPDVPEVAKADNQKQTITIPSENNKILDANYDKQESKTSEVSIDQTESIMCMEVVAESSNSEVITESNESIAKVDEAEKRHDIASIGSSDKSNEDVFLPSAVNNDVHTNDISCKNNAVENTPTQEVFQESVSTASIRKRKWGSRTSKVTKPSTLSISTDSLKNLISHVEPVSVEDVLMDVKPKETEKLILDKVKSSDDRKSNGKYNVPDKKEKDILGSLSHRKISIVNEEIPKEQRPPSPPKYKSSCILYITNLVRPFTLPQLKNLLQRTGKIVENGFWIDRIKSRCYVQYQNEDEAIETRHALHGVTWPVSNPKTLNVDFGSASDMRTALASGEDEKPVSHMDTWPKEITLRDNKISGKENEGKMFEKRTVVREWDMGKGDGRDERPERPTRGGAHPLEGERRKRRSKSPSPARKFKKKEEEAPSKLLDDLFKKTKATPCIYWLPLNAETILVKEEQRRKHMAEHERRLEELRRATEERNSRNPPHHPPSHRHR